MKRLTIAMNEDLHRKFSVYCILNDKKITQKILEMIEALIEAEGKRDEGR